MNHRYETYLHSGDWRRKRRARLALARNRCSACEGATGLQVHHLSYEHFGNEPLSDLLTLCDLCHGLVHDLVRDGQASIDSPHAGLFDPERAEANRLSNPVVARYHDQKVEAQRERVVTASKARHREQVQRQETDEDRERAVGVAALLGFELPSH